MFKTNGEVNNYMKLRTVTVFLPSHKDEVYKVITAYCAYKA